MPIVCDVFIFVSLVAYADANFICDSAVQDIAGISHRDNDVGLCDVVAQDFDHDTQVQSSFDGSNITVAVDRGVHRFRNICQTEAVSIKAFAVFFGVKELSAKAPQSCSVSI
jgi:hypothetical protein